MSDNITPAPQTAPEPVSPIIIPFPRCEEMPKPRAEFPLATARTYAAYLDLFIARVDQYDTFIDLCNHLYSNTIAGAGNPNLFQMLINAIGIATRALIEDLDEMEEKMLLGTLAAEDAAPAGVEVTEVVEAPEDDGMIMEETFFMEGQDGDFPMGN